MPDRAFVNIGRDTALYIAVDQIEAVLSDGRGNARVLAISGKEYRTERTSREVLDLITKAVST